MGEIEKSMTEQLEKKQFVNQCQCCDVLYLVKPEQCVRCRSVIFFEVEKPNCNSNFHDEGIREQFTKSESCSVCGVI